MFESAHCYHSEKSGCNFVFLIFASFLRKQDCLTFYWKDLSSLLSNIMISLIFLYNICLYLKMFPLENAFAFNVYKRKRIKLMTEHWKAVENR